MLRSLLLSGLVGLLVLCAVPLRGDDLTVLTPETAGGPPKQMLSRHLRRLVGEALEQRRSAYEKVQSPEDAAAWQQRLRSAFIEHLGGFPERTPLNARVLGGLEGDRYRVEKILFESQPRHYVTAVLFLPTATEPPYPAVVMPCGHTPAGKVENQSAAMLLAQNGFACLCYDPIGQGERYQFLDAAGKPRFGGTTEHTIVGAGSIPLGRGTATYRIWDGIRALDYLASRDDIAAEKIGVSGCSGGGTLTSYLMALDERVACAAPSCYITSLERLIDTIGPQDAEQNIHGQLAFGMDHADYLLLRAPRPTLILASTRDFFDISGTWDSFRQAKRFYTRLGAPERVALVETDAKHGYPQPQREAMVHWMQRWLVGKDAPVTELGITRRPNEDYVCTAPGQVLLLDGARSVVDLNVELNARYEPDRRKLWDVANKAPALAEVRRIAGIRPLSDIPPAKATSAGAVPRDGYRLEKLTLETEPGIVLPALLFQPAKPTGRLSLIVAGDGKDTVAGPDGPAARLAQEGTRVLVVDLRGVGEIGTTGAGQWGGDWKEFFVAYLLGQPLLGMRAEDVLSCTRYLAQAESGAAPRPVHLHALGVVGPAALHAAALEPHLFETLTLENSLPSWSHAVAHPDEPGILVNTVHGALRAYDLPDLRQSLPQGKLREAAQ